MTGVSAKTVYAQSSDIKSRTYGDMASPKNNTPSSAICRASVFAKTVLTAKLRRENNATNKIVATICAMPASKLKSKNF